jgi:hypothetical protein
MRQPIVKETVSMLARSLRLSLASLALAGIALLGTPRSAYSQLELQATITQAGQTPIFVDFLAPAATPHTLSLPDTVIPLAGGGNLTVLASTSTSNSPGVAAADILMSFAGSVQNNSASTVTVSLRISDNGFTLPPSPNFYQASGSGNFNIQPGFSTNVNGAQATVIAFASTTNTKFATDIPVENSGVLAAPSGVGNFGYSNTGTTVGPFPFGPAGHSETIGQDFTLPAFVSLTGRLNSETSTGVAGAVPEIDPGSAVSALACLGSGVLMLAGGRRRRARA